MPTALSPAACLPGCRWVDNEGDYDQFKLPSERTDEIVKEDVLLMKVRGAALRCAGLQPSLRAVPC